MTTILVIVSLTFTVWRFASPGHAVSPSGSVEAMAHVYMGVVVTLFVQGVRKWWADQLDQDSNDPWMPFPWLLFALWFVPSMVELVLFLVGPFNPFKG